MRNLFSWFARANQSKKARTRCVSLQVRTLEERCCPSGGAVEWSDPDVLGGAVAYSAVVQPSGRIVVAGKSVASNNQLIMTLAEFDANGGLNSGFGSKGFVTSNKWTLPYPSTTDVVMLYPTGGSGDQQLLVVGPSTSGTFTLARYNSDGSLDTSFGKNGIVDTSFTQGTAILGDGVVLEPNGTSPPKILVAGSDNANAGLEMARYNSNGSLDTSFGSGGKLYTAIAGGIMLGALASDPVSGDLIVAGQEHVANCPGVIVAFQPSGALDNSFGTNGVVSSSIEGSGVYPTSLAIYPTTDANGNGGEIVFGGSNGVARYRTTGILDTSWRNVSSVVADSLAIQSDGKVLAGGYSWVVARLNNDGSLDNSFGSGGVASAGLPVGGTSSRDILVQPDGDILEVGGALVSSGKSANALAVVCFLPSEPEIGSFTASQSAAGAPVSLIASNITDGNPNSTIKQVTFYYYDASGNKIVVGTATAPDGSGNWTVSASLPPGSYTLYAQATDSYGILGDPLAYTLTIQ